MRWCGASGVRAPGGPPLRPRPPPPCGPRPVAVTTSSPPQETPGEDPLTNGEYAAALSAGMQGGHPEYLQISACAKHFAVEADPQNNPRASPLGPKV